MNSISFYFKSMFYKFLFNIKLKKTIRLYGKEVVRRFDLVDSTNSYWIDCNSEYLYPPRIIKDDKEFSGSLRKQTEIAMKSWQFFPISDSKDLFGLTKYFVWLRNNNEVNKRHYDIGQNKVSDHIYEM